MTKIIIKTRIAASREICFDLARDIETHLKTSAFTDERIVQPGRTSGLLELGDLITLEAKHLGIRQRLTARITMLDRPNRLVDETVSGAFTWLRHVHDFREDRGGTVMIDTIEWRSPLGVLGKIADWLIVESHMRWFVRTKQLALKDLAESLSAAELVDAVRPRSG